MFTIAVDANPILAALLGGYARTILFDPRFLFVTAAFTLAEVRHHFSTIAEQSGILMAELEEVFGLLPLTVYVRAAYQTSMAGARRRIGHIDLDDIDILALALFKEIPLWTNDRHFEKLDPPVPILKTKDFLL